MPPKSEPTRPRSRVRRLQNCPCEGTPSRSLLAIIPALDEERHIADVVRTTSEHVDAVLVVDDGSRDRTSEIARAAGATVLRHARRRGKAYALKTGYAYALRHDFSRVVTLDGDGQHDPREIPRLIAAMEAAGAHVVTGNRMHDTREMPGSRRATNRLCSWVATVLTGQEIPDSLSGFRVTEAEVLRQVSLRADHFSGDPELVVWACFRSFRVAAVPIRCIYGDERSDIHPIADAIRLLVLCTRAVAESVRMRWRR